MRFAAILTTTMLTATVALADSYSGTPTLPGTKVDGPIPPGIPSNQMVTAGEFNNGTTATGDLRSTVQGKPGSNLPLDVRSATPAAKCDGTTDDTAAINAALAARAHVIIPPAVCHFNGAVAIPANTKLEISNGGMLDEGSSGSLELAGSGSSLIGHSFNSTATGSSGHADAKSNLVYHGSGVALSAEVTNGADGWALDGVVIDCLSTSGTTGFQIGSASHSGAYAHVGTGTTNNCMAHSLDVFGLQASSIDHWNAIMTSDSFSPTGVGVYLEGQQVITELAIYRLNMTGYGISFRGGDPGNTNNFVASNVSVLAGTLQGYPTDNGIGLDVHACYSCQFKHLQIAGPGGNSPPGPNGSTVAIILGGPAGGTEDARARNVTFEDLEIGGFKVMVRGYGWENVRFSRDFFNMSSSDSARTFFDNVGGRGRTNGIWENNYIAGQITPDIFDIKDRTGFEKAFCHHVSPSNAIDGVYECSSGWTVSMLNDTTYTLLDNSFFGEFNVAIQNSGTHCVFHLRSSFSTAVDKDVDVTSSCDNSHNAGADDGKVHVYWDSGTSRYLIQNTTGGGVTLSLAPHGLAH